MNVNTNLTCEEMMLRMTIHLGFVPHGSFQIYVEADTPYDVLIPVFGSSGTEDPLSGSMTIQAIPSSGDYSGWLFRARDLDRLRIFWPDAWYGADMMIEMLMMENEFQITPRHRIRLLGYETTLVTVIVPLSPLVNAVQFAFFYGPMPDGSRSVRCFDLQETPEPKMVVGLPELGLCEVSATKSGLWWRVGINTMPKSGPETSIRG